MLLFTLCQSSPQGVPKPKATYFFLYIGLRFLSKNMASTITVGAHPYNYEDRLHIHHSRGVPRIFGEGGGPRGGGGGCRDPPKKLTSQTSVQLG